MKRVSSSRSGTIARPQNIDAYLGALSPKARSGLQRVREAIRATAPDAEEGFSYGMPAFKVAGRPLMGFAAAKNHSSLFPFSPAVIRAHAADLKRYQTSKGTVRFPPDKPPPRALVAKLVKARLAELQGPR